MDSLLYPFILYRKPVLVIQPKVKGVVLPTDFSICLSVAILPETFPLEKLKATKNNLRSAVTKGSTLDQEQSLMPTPQYNASILEVDSKKPPQNVVYSAMRVLFRQQFDNTKERLEKSQHVKLSILVEGVSFLSPNT